MTRFAAHKKEKSKNVLKNIHLALYIQYMSFRNKKRVIRSRLFTQRKKYEKFTRNWSANTKATTVKTEQSFITFLSPQNQRKPDRNNHWIEISHSELFIISPAQYFRAFFTPKRLLSTTVINELNVSFFAVVFWQHLCISIKNYLHNWNCYIVLALKVAKWRCSTCNCGETDARHWCGVQCDTIFSIESLNKQKNLV